MSIADYESFFRERLSIWNGTLDVSPGSPIDTQVVQPLLRRIGTDPFTVDASTFMISRLSQEFPEVAIGGGDGIEDLMIKPLLLLWDPFIREAQRIKNARSFSDPDTLTIEEAEALGSSFFIPRDTGDKSRGPVRIYYAQPQQQTITAANFITSKTGMHYFPTGKQSIKAGEMALNKEGDLYYFDVSTIAESTGDEYNVEPDSMTTIANVDAAIRVTNKVRFQDGRPAENAADYVGRLQRSIGEKSLVTLRGIAAVLGESIPEISRLAVVGFNDPEMQRDILTGGGLGAPIVTGLDGEVISDGLFKPASTRFRSVTADFTTLGSAGPSEGYTITLVNAFTGGQAPIQDLQITRILSANELEVDRSILFLGRQDVAFVVRRQELTLSGIPGGIVQPNGPNGTLVIENNKVHIGGMTDMYVRGLSLDTGTLILDTVSDETPELDGVDCFIPPNSEQLALGDLVLGTTYQVGDRAHQLLSEAKVQQYALQILDGPLAATYRILDVAQTQGSRPLLTLDPQPLLVSSPPSFRWRLVTQVTLDLAEPREVRVAGTDGSAIQNQDLFTTTSPTDFDALGVSAGDILRIKTGVVLGDYKVVEVISPGFTSLRVDRVFSNSLTGSTYEVFRANRAGGVDSPLVRIKQVDLLDTSGQPLGSTIPYAKAIDIRSSSFSNVGSGVKARLPNATFGIVSVPIPVGGLAFGAGGAVCLIADGTTPVCAALVGTMTAAAIASAFNASSVGNADVGYPIAFVRPDVGNTFRVCFTPFGPNTRSDTSSMTQYGVLFGSAEVRHSRDVRDASSNPVSWDFVSPRIDPRLDVVWAMDGLNRGFFRVESWNTAPPAGFTNSSALRVHTDLAPDFRRAAALGSRSFGTARMYFLDPTSVEIGPNTEFKATTSSGVDIYYRPDTTLSYQVVPPLPGGDKPLDGATTGGLIVSDSGDFIRQGIRAGDFVEIDFEPVYATANLADPVLTLALKTLNISLSDQLDRTVTFVNDVGTSGAVSRSSVAEQINSSMGQEICEIVETSPDVFRLKFNVTRPLKIRGDGSANPLLGLPTIDTDNVSPNAGSYEIDSTTDTALIITGAFADNRTEQQFRVTRPQTQRITATSMATQKAAAGLYYFDVELFSEGPGDLWNLPPDSAMTATGYASDGYYLSTADENTTFSPYESVRLHLSRSILPVGVDDSPENAIQLSGQSVSIAYEYSALINTLHSFVTADTERVVNSNPLARHLIPHFVRFDLNYAGGSRESEILPDLEKYVTNVLPDSPLESSDLQGIVTGRGATSIQNPIDLLAVVYNIDRSVTVARSQDAISTGRLAAFIPDQIKLTRRSR